MLILPVIETESKMFENLLHLHFLTGVLFLKYRKYWDPYHICICEKESRIRKRQGPRIPRPSPHQCGPVAERVQECEGSSAKVYKSKSPEVRRATAEKEAEV